MWFDVRVAFFAPALLLAACGFAPILGQGQNTQIQLASFDLPDTPLGLAVQHALAGRITLNAEASYAARLSVRETRQDRLINEHGQATRQDITLSGNLQVFSKDKQGFTFSETISVTDSFDRPADELTRQANAEAAVERLVRQLVAEVVLVLARLTPEDK